MAGTGIRLDEFALPGDGQWSPRDLARLALIEFDLLSGEGECATHLEGPTRPVTSAPELISEIQYALLETVDRGGGISSGFWTVQEVYDYLNQRQRRFLKDTALILTRAEIPTIPNTHRQPLPDDWVMTEMVTWLPSDPNARLRVSVPRGDGWEADHGNFEWEYASSLVRPQVWMDAETNTLEIQIAPSVGVSGVLELLYVAISTLFVPTQERNKRIDEYKRIPDGEKRAADRMRHLSIGFAIGVESGGVFFSIPDEFLPALKWGVIADMLKKVGRAQDLARAEYAENRYTEGVEAARIMLRGWA
jgi:hypothetical protein